MKKTGIMKSNELRRQIIRMVVFLATAKILKKHILTHLRLQLVSRYFEHSQPPRIIAELEINFILSPSIKSPKREPFMYFWILSSGELRP